MNPSRRPDIRFGQLFGAGRGSDRPEPPPEPQGAQWWNALLSDASAEHRTVGAWLGEQSSLQHLYMRIATAPGITDVYWAYVFESDDIEGVAASGAVGFSAACAERIVDLWPEKLRFVARDEDGALLVHGWLRLP